MSGRSSELPYTSGALRPRKRQVRFNAPPSPLPTTGLDQSYTIYKAGVGRGIKNPIDFLDNVVTEEDEPQDIKQDGEVQEGAVTHEVHHGFLWYWSQNLKQWFGNILDRYDDFRMNHKINQLATLFLLLTICSAINTGQYTQALLYLPPFFAVSGLSHDANHIFENYLPALRSMGPNVNCTSQDAFASMWIAGLAAHYWYNRKSAIRSALIHPGAFPQLVGEPYVIILLYIAVMVEHRFLYKLYMRFPEPYHYTNIIVFEIPKVNAIVAFVGTMALVKQWPNKAPYWIAGLVILVVGYEIDWRAWGKRVYTYETEQLRKAQAESEKDQPKWVELERMTRPEGRNDNYVMLQHSFANVPYVERPVDPWEAEELGFDLNEAIRNQMRQWREEDAENGVSAEDDIQAGLNEEYSGSEEEYVDAQPGGQNSQHSSPRSQRSWHSAQSSPRSQRSWHSAQSSPRSQHSNRSPRPKKSNKKSNWSRTAAGIDPDVDPSSSSSSASSHHSHHSPILPPAPPSPSDHASAPDPRGVPRRIPTPSDATPKRTWIEALLATYNSISKDFFGWTMHLFWATTTVLSTAFFAYSGYKFVIFSRFVVLAPLAAWITGHLYLIPAGIWWVGEQVYLFYNEMDEFTSNPAAKWREWGEEGYRGVAAVFIALGVFWGVMGFKDVFGWIANLLVTE